MLCENCHKKQAIMHMVCLVGDKQIDKWLCGDCAKDYLPMGMGDMPLTPEGAKRFLDEMLKGAGRKPKKKVAREASARLRPRCWSWLPRRLWTAAASI